MSTKIIIEHESGSGQTRKISVEFEDMSVLTPDRVRSAVSLVPEHSRITNVWVKEDDD